MDSFFGVKIFNYIDITSIFIYPVSLFESLLFLKHFTPFVCHQGVLFNLTRYGPYMTQADKVQIQINRKPEFDHLTRAQAYQRALKNL